MTDPATIQVKERLKALNSLVHDIETGRLRSESTLESINKAHEVINHEGIKESSKNTQYQKLKNLYAKAFNDAANEEELLRLALSKIYEIRSVCNKRRFQQRTDGNRGAIHKGALMKMVQVSAQTLPLWVGKLNGSKPPPLCGAIPADPNYIAKPGDMVAALVKAAPAADSFNTEENWILAEVVSFNPVTKKFEVDDIHEDHKPRHTLSKSRVVSLPLMRSNPETDPEALYPKGALVMALFPQTTCFYKAIVKQQPATATDEYEVLFEDSSYPTGYAPPLKVSQRYVIEIKEKKMKQ